MWRQGRNRVDRYRARISPFINLLSRCGRNAEFPDECKLQFRTRVNLGDVIVDRHEIYGDGVNVVARLESLADPGGICISEAVRTAVGNKLPLDFDDMGEQRVKNIQRTVHVYRSRLKPGECLGWMAHGTVLFQGKFR